MLSARYLLATTHQASAEKSAEAEADAFLDDLGGLNGAAATLLHSFLTGVDIDPAGATILVMGGVGNESLEVRLWT